MASIPCSIHAEFSSTSATVASWSHPYSPPLLELCSAGAGRPWLSGSGKTLALGRNRNPSMMMGTQVGAGGARECELPRYSCFRSQMSLQFMSVPSSRHQQCFKNVKLSGDNLGFMYSALLFPSAMRNRGSIRWGSPPSATDSSEITSEISPNPSTSSSGVASDETNVDLGSTEASAGGAQATSTDAQPTPGKIGTAKKASPLTAREKLRAARVLSKYAETKPSVARSEMGSKVLDAIKETDRGKKKRSGLPEAPSNLFDDSKRGLPKPGLTFDFPGGNDILLIAFSFVFISTVMFATTYIVWKAGAIHFNEY